MRVNVCYRVPVVCVVDTESRKIERVIVDDESIGGVEYCETSQDCTRLAEDSKLARAARRLAEGQAWPAWGFGW